MQGADRIIHSKLYHLCQVAASLCRSEEATIKSCYQRALNSGITVAELREVILTSYLFDGYPTALEGFRLLGELSDSSQDHSERVDTSGVKDSLLSYSTESMECWRERGERLCKRIYGPQYAPLMERVAVIAPELSESMIIEGYGKVLSRIELDTMLRELCVVAILVVKNRPRQLMSHALGAQRLGAIKDHLDTALRAISDLLPTDDLQQSKDIITTSLTKAMS